MYSYWVLNKKNSHVFFKSLVISSRFYRKAQNIWNINYIICFSIVFIRVYIVCAAIKEGLECLILVQFYRFCRWEHCKTNTIIFRKKQKNRYTKRSCVCLSYRCRLVVSTLACIGYVFIHKHFTQQQNSGFWLSNNTFFVLF